MMIEKKMKKIIFLPALLSFFCTLFLRFLSLSLSCTRKLTDNFLFHFILFSVSFQIYRPTSNMFSVVVVSEKKTQQIQLNKTKNKKNLWQPSYHHYYPTIQKKIGPPCLFVCSLVTLIFSSIQNI